MAERVGFEPTCPLLAGKTLSRRPRYDRFGTSPREKRIIELLGHRAIDLIPQTYRLVRFTVDGFRFLLVRKKS